MTDLGEAASEIRGGAMRLARRLRAERPTDALSGNKVIVLSHLYRNGSSTPGSIALAERQQPQSLTRAFTELQEAGLVVRRRSGRDRRESVLTITDQGIETLSKDMAQRDRWLAQALQVLTNAEIDMLRIAARLMDGLADRAERAERPDSADRPDSALAEAQVSAP
jgi:DNA-binding MarR family transcriptional regulator